jgi:hypothetical protein
MTAKQKFLEEHNKLSPDSLQATMPMLTQFRNDKASLFKDAEWSVDKLRRPFIIWLTSLTSEERVNIDRK